MTNEEEKAMVQGQVAIINDLITRKYSHEESAKEFLLRLPILTKEFFDNIPEEQFNKEAKALKELFDSFAIIDEFDSFLIIDCYNEIRISMIKVELVADKASTLAIEFKHLLSHFYEVMKGLYFYEIFGFFSTSVWPEYIPQADLPCRIFCGCADGWQKEPYLTIDGEAAYENVIRFEDPQNKDVPLCMTIDNPHLLEDREKCSLSDEQLEIVKNFVRDNREIIILHVSEIIGSTNFIYALKAKYSHDRDTSKYRIAYTFEEDNTTYYLDLNDMSYREAKKFYKEIFKAVLKDTHRFSYTFHSLKIVKPSRL